MPTKNVPAKTRKNLNFFVVAVIVAALIIVGLSGILMISNFSSRTILDNTRTPATEATTAPAATTAASTIATPTIRLTLTGHTGSVWSVVFSLDGKTLASGSHDKTIRLWDVASGQPKGSPLTGHTDSVTSVVFSPDGKTLASASDDRTIRLWDVASGQPKGSPLTGYTNYVFSVAFSPDGKTLATGSDSKTIHLWDININP